MMRRLFAGLAMVVAMGSVAAAQDENPIAAMVKEKVGEGKPFVLVVELRAKAGQGGKLEEAFAPAIKETLKEKGCKIYHLSRDADDKDAFVLYEHWDSVGDLSKHLAAPHITKVLGALGELTDGPPKATVRIPAGH